MTLRLEARMDNCGRMEQTHQELVERLEGVGMTATATGGKGTKAGFLVGDKGLFWAPLQLLVWFHSIFKMCTLLGLFMHRKLISHHRLG